MSWPFSVLILTLNEECDLPCCLASVADCDDIVRPRLRLLGSDRRRSPARQALVFSPVPSIHSPASAITRSGRSSFRHPWVFHLDADERMTAGLAAECAAGVPRADIDGFLVAPRMMFEGRWIPHCTDYPAWQARFVRAPRVFLYRRRSRSAGGARNASGASASGLPPRDCLRRQAEWLEKHRSYARAEAREHLSANAASHCNLPDRPVLGLFSRDPLRRRRTLKRLSYSFPFRPILRFLYQYLLRRGFLDGRPGLSYCLLLSRYESFVAEELRRMRRITPARSP